jgi:hypothetical protein
MRSDRVFQVLFGGAFPLLGILLLVISFAIYRSNAGARETGVLTTGNVVGMEERYDSDGSMYAPIIRFTTIEGEVVEFTSSTWSRPAAYGPGDTVEVLYQPDDPNGAEVDSAFERYGASAILGLVGLLLAVVGGVVAFVLTRFLFAGSSADLPPHDPEPSAPRARRKRRRGGRARQESEPQQQRVSRIEA